MRRSLLILPAIASTVVLFHVASCSKGGGDAAGPEEDTPPSRITDLAVAQVTSASVTLTWSAPDGGGSSTSAASYDLRCAASPIDASNWASALEIEDEPAPAQAGLPQSMLITGEAPFAVVHFAMRSCGQAGLWSEVSNSPAAIVPPDEPVTFADAALEEVIRAILQRPQGDIMPADLLAVTEIAADHRGIQALGGIEYCPSLHRLLLAENAVTDLQPLSDLARLSELDVSNNQVADVSPLADLVGLMNLDLRGNACSEIGALQQMEVLNFLWLDGNQIVDITPVAGCWRLNHLFVADNQIDDLAPLASMKYLADLDLSDNAVEDLAPLVANADFGPGDRIWLARNPLSAAAVNEQIPALRARGVIVYFE